MESKNTEQNQSLSLQIEKNLAVLTLKQADILESRALIRSYIEKIIQNPSLYTALVLLNNRSFNTLPFKKALKSHSREEWEECIDDISHLFQTMENSQVSWIAGLSGPCFGPSLQMALSCDYRIADSNTLFGFNELHLGLIPTGGACLRLPRLIGIKKALDMILKGEVLTAHKAQRHGLIQETLAPFDLKPYVREWAGKINKGLFPAKPPQKYRKLTVKDRLWEIPFFRYWFYYRMRKHILSQTKGFYPAPLRALSLMKKTYPVRSLRSELKEEINVFCDLIVSPTAQNLISLHKDLKELKQKTTAQRTSPGGLNGAPSFRIKKVAIIGAGAMGGGITHWLAHNQIPVLLKDIHSPSLSNTLKYIYTSFQQKNQKSFTLKKFKNTSSYWTPLLPFPPQSQSARWPLNGPSSAQILFSKVRPQMDYSGFKKADLIIETVVEDQEIKKKVILESTKQCHPQSLFASNTSSFKIKDLSEAHPDRDRFFGLHFFYPAYHSPLIEVVQGTKNQSSLLNSLCEWIWQTGKVPFLVQDSPGFLVQRLFLPLISSSLWCLKEGVDIQHIDHIYTSFGFRAGPFQLMDELGLDIFLKLIKSFSSAGCPIPLPEEISRLKPGFLGKKNKKGFYIYNEKRKILSVNNRMIQDLGFKPSYKTVNHILEKGLYLMINESAKLLEEKVVESPKEVDLAFILGLGFPAFRGGLLKYGQDISLKTVIASLHHWTHHLGDRFQPSPALLARQETGFF